MGERKGQKGTVEQHRGAPCVREPGGSPELFVLAGRRVVRVLFTPGTQTGLLSCS